MVMVGLVTTDPDLMIGGRTTTFSWSPAPWSVEWSGPELGGLLLACLLAMKFWNQFPAFLTRVADGSSGAGLGMKPGVLNGS